jgi:hypothetical protein
MTAASGRPALRRVALWSGVAATSAGIVAAGSDADWAFWAPAAGAALATAVGVGVAAHRWLARRDDPARAVRRRAARGRPVGHSARSTGLAQDAVRDLLAEAPAPAGKFFRGRRDRAAEAAAPPERATVSFAELLAASDNRR